MNEKQNIGSLFNRIAHSYDSLNHLLSLNIDRYWRRKAVKMLRPADSQTVCCLDVAIGTADLAIEIINQKKADIIVGIDLSDEMMRIGKEKVQKKNYSESISFLNESALSMPFEDNSFDLVTCSFGVRNFSDLDLGLSEMYRVMKKNGQLMILEFSYPKNKLIAFIYDLYFSHILPFVGRLFSKDKTAYTYLNRSVKNFVWGDEFLKHLKKIGFTDCSIMPLTFGIATVYTAIKD
ncbi:MAG: bifunctional demethylmenaquinone methyltransferase/2-methoxy-6-polyprenyl-1,4-benzoquinol methylase UbiE [Paludibacteraceae bacterium]|nr:bifunctional demethylmenaquinone methyltransferase/2-methoxy-6-polyprenyl-1,4-benzoquinol methylase UbiE [Paludibacteraceae bacterium]